MAEPSWCAWDRRACTAEMVLRLAQSRVVALDRAALAADFPHLAGRPDEAFEAFLLRAGAWISTSNVASREVSTAVPVTSDTQIGWRPARYGRALVLPTPGLEGGHVDVKGLGVAPQVRPQPAWHRDGLMLQAYALKEFLLRGMVDAVLERFGAPLRALPIYGVIDPGFDALRAGQAAAAGLLVRRAHARDAESDLPRAGSPAQADGLQVELLLRAAGLTLAHDQLEVCREVGGFRVATGGVEAFVAGETSQGAFLRDLVPPAGWRGDLVAAQSALDEGGRPDGLLDLELCHLETRFTRPVISVVRDRPFGVGAVLDVLDPGFPQPHPQLSWAWRDLAGRMPAPPATDRRFLDGTGGVDRLVALCLELSDRFRARALDWRGVTAELASVVARL